MGKACMFAEWLLGNVIDSENGGYYMHHKSGLETNRAYSIIELFRIFDKPKQTKERIFMPHEIKMLKKCSVYMTKELLNINMGKIDISEMHQTSRINYRFKNNI